MSTPRERLASGLQRQADELDGTTTLHAQVIGTDGNTLSNGQVSVSPSSVARGAVYLQVAERPGIKTIHLAGTTLDRDRAIFLGRRLVDLAGGIEILGMIHGAARALIRDAASRFGIRSPEEFDCPYFRALAEGVVADDPAILERLGRAAAKPRGVAPEVSDAISSERAYQAHRWAPAEPGQLAAQDADDRTLDEFALYVVGYAQDLLHQASHSGDHKATLDILRKIATLAVVAMERHGAPQRPGYEVGPR